MRNSIFLLSLISIVFFFTGCLSQSQDVSSSNKNTNSQNSAIKIKTVFPATPVVTQGGNLKLTTIVTDADENYLESTVANPIDVTWSSSDETVVTVDGGGTVYGVKEGSAEITLVATQGALTSSAYKITVNVVNVNAVDVAEVYLSLSSAYIDLNANRTFRLTAVDYAGTQTSLSEGTVKFEVSNANVEIDKQEIVLDTSGNAVEISLTGKSKGYSFVTPIYEISENGTVIKITGTPLIIQVKDPAESSRPTEESVDAGKYLTMSIQENEGKKLIHVGHYDSTLKSFSYSYFNGSWDHDLIALPYDINTSNGEGSKLVLSPFSDNKEKPMVVMIEDNKPVMWYQSWPNGGWIKKDLTTTSIFNDAYPYTEKLKLIDIATTEDDSSNGSLNLIHVAYFDRVNAQICMQTHTSLTTVSNNNCFTTNGEVTGLSLSSNSVTGEPRLVYILENSDIKYVTRQGSDIYRESVTNTTGKEEQIIIKLDGNDVPTVVTYSGFQIGMYTRKSVGSEYLWEFKNISGLDPLPKTISSVDFSFDSYNEPRVVFSSDDKVRYARRVYSGNSYKWVVDSPGESGEGVQGDYSSIFVDSSNRAHIVYSVTDKNWFNYWAEPNFFDYRVFPENSYVGADIIKE